MARPPKNKPAAPRVNYVRTTISMPEEVYKKAQECAAKRGFQASLSSYLAWLCEQAAQGQHLPK